MKTTKRKMTLGERLILPELVKGYAVTLKNFGAKPTTMQYPEERWETTPANEAPILAGPVT